MDRDQEGLGLEDGDLAGDLLHGRAIGRRFLVPRPQDDEVVGVEGLELRKMLRLEAVLHRGEVQPVLLRDAGELLLARIDDVEPDEGGLR